MIRLLLVDDQTLVRQGFRVLLETSEDIQVVGESADGKQALQQVEALQPDIVLLDVRMMFLAFNQVAHSPESLGGLGSTAKPGNMEGKTIRSSNCHFLINLNIATTNLKV